MINKESWIYLGDLKDAKNNDKEIVEWFDRDKLPKNILSNLNWLIPFAANKFNDKALQKFSVNYD